MHLNFNLPGRSDRHAARGAELPDHQLIEYRLGGLDMAVCRIGGNPGNTYGFTEVSTTDAGGRRHAVHHRPPGRAAEADRGRADARRSRQPHPLQRHRHARRQLRIGHPPGIDRSARRCPHQRRLQLGRHRQQLRGMRITSIAPTRRPCGTSTCRRTGWQTSRSSVMSSRRRSRDVLATTALRDKPILSDIRTTPWRDIATAALRDNRSSATSGWASVWATSSTPVSTRAASISRVASTRVSGADPSCWPHRTTPTSARR